MDLRQRAATPATTRLPRTRGDGPRVDEGLLHPRVASPHTRGWTRHADDAAVAAGGFPAHAGMDPAYGGGGGGKYGLPRTRGDGPLAFRDGSKVFWASPHTRGWTRQADDAAVAAGGFPAHAGMDRMDVELAEECGWLPRTRGDGPVDTKASSLSSMASPHTRGWTLIPHEVEAGAIGFPAHAGMDPSLRDGHGEQPRLPRTRGDGPACWMAYRLGIRASPHTRGWTPPGSMHRPILRGFPAHAGMDPTAGRLACRLPRLPRTRGDGPDGEGEGGEGH